LDIKELYKYAYIKRPLNEIYKDSSSVPQEFLMDWYKDSYDYQRLHTDDELKETLKLTPEQILEWLEEAMIFAWETKKAIKVLSSFIKKRGET